MRPLELQTPMWPTKGTSQLMSGIGVQTIQCGKVLGGTMVLLSLFMLMLAVLNVLPFPHPRYACRITGLSSCMEYQG